MKRIFRSKRSACNLLIPSLLTLILLGLGACSKVRDNPTVPSGPSPSVHPEGWIDPSVKDSFHGQAIRANGWDMSDCQGCHGTDYAGGVSQVSCLTCHSDTPEDCSVCHGGKVNLAPPRDTQGNTATSVIGVGAHQAHVRAGKLGRAFDCTECHVVPSTFAASTHIDSIERAEIVFATLASQGATKPNYDPQTATCASVYCHGDQPVVWTAVGTDQAACGTCHELPPGGDHPETNGLSCASCHGAVVDDNLQIINKNLHINGQVEVAIEAHPAGWIDTSSDNFHGQAIRTAAWDMSDCQRCHGSDYAGGIAQSSCLTCHADTPEDCSVCHGSDVNSAPPQDTHTNTATSFIGVGAHQAHLLESDLTSTLACAECHTVPSSFADPAHIDGDGKAELIWGTVAKTGGAAPQFDDQTATCASVYCHGDQSVVWTEVGTDQATCGTCHELPPGGDHPVTNDLSCASCHGAVVDADNAIVDKTLHINGKVEVTMAACGTCHELPPPIATGHPETDGLSCASCHGAVVDADNTIIDETLHINGKVEVSIEGHPTGWLESSSDDFHGQAIRTAGWDMTDCQRCHGSDYAGGITQSSCLTCHPSTPEDCSVCHGSDVNSAPPQDTHANSATSFIGVGAHQAHLLDSDLTTTLACAECHTVPSSFADPAHIDGDGKAELIWGSVATTDNATPQFDDQTATCASVYCHGDQSVVWTEVGTDQAACGTCHELPPGGDHPVTNDLSCANCHGTVVNADNTIVDKTLHINGKVEVTMAACGTCHELPPPIATGHPETDGLSCASCHGAVVDADNTIIDETLHINGKVEVAIEGHPTGWLESSSDDFHGQAIRTAGWDMTDCQRCHGSDYAGGITQSSCLTCHPSTPEDCSVCHGSDVNSAPPQDTHANSATSFIGVGAHQAHLLDSDLTATLACAECHTVPSSFADPVHIDGDGKAELIWGTVAKTGGAAPQFDDQTATCASIYCHGDQSVVWTEVGTDQAACGTCHELPPGGDHPETNGLSCASCHGTVVDADNTIIDRTLHINGKVEVAIEGHPIGWLESSSDDFHGQAIRTAGWDMTDCQRCHGSDYAGGITQSSCLTCHPSTPEDCSVCHGSDVNSAPPQDTHANSATSFIGVGAHQAHLLDSNLTSTLACAECHTVPASFADPAHIDGDGKAELSWGSVATTGDVTPQFDDQTATCASIYCHGDQSVVWTEVGTDQAACGTCHELPPGGDHPETNGLSCASCHGAVVDADNTIIDKTLHINGKVEVSIEGHPTGWLESSSDDFHGQAIRTAGWDMTDCQRCHGSDYAGGITQSSCLTCHPSTPEDCSVCHGSDVNSAPPQDTHANSATSFIGVGAHQAHLLDSDLTATLACAECHTVPSTFSDPAHIDGDGKAELIWGSVATTDNATPQFDDQTATCASVYCHGDQSVIWTEVGTDQAACGTCHELPPGGDHPETNGLSCASCHGAVVDADNTIIDRTLHINGKVEVAIEGHPTGWLESSSDDFHGQAIRTAGWDMTDCQRCHGNDYAGGITQSSCLTCHPSTPEDCSVCHGSDVNSAPPQDTHTNTATSFIGVGAHQAHLLDSDLTTTLACAECHTVPSSFADPAHIDGDGKAELIWGTVATTDNATPQFDDQTATCASVYCHGDQSVIWTEVGTDQAACGTCHELPPGGDHPETNGLSCASCHSAVVDADNTIIDKTLHINGKVEVAIEGHPIGWLESSSDDFHGQAIRTAGWDMTDCQRCHGSDYAGGITQSSCLTCHPSTPEDCSVCHGSDVNSAPPQDTHANSATSFIGVGAHQAHLLDSDLTTTLACAECHTVPSSFADPAHIDGDGKAELIWGTIATNDDTNPQFDDQTATCASIYCHGDQSVVWTEVGTDQAACGTCHELPPGGDHPETDGLSCASCHGTVVDADNTIIDKTLHINGKTDVTIEGHPTGWLDTSSDDFHGQAIRAAGWDMTDCQRCHGSDYAGGITQSSCLTCHPSTPEDCSVCHGSDVNSAPPQDTHANSATSFIGVGAHQAHLLDSNLTTTLACAECHTVPSSFADPAHIDGDGKAELSWGSVAKTGGAAPQFDDQTTTCASVYCHGDQSVVWTEVGTDQAACGTCHELPPGGDHPETNGLSCTSCHSAVVDADNTIIDRTLHINGKVEVTIEGHPTGWLESSSDDFHGQAIRTAGWDMTDCQSCHGSDYAGGIAQVSCLTCHENTPEDCSVCHGSDVNSAPPQDTHANSATNFIGVGAHQAHLLDSNLTSALACAECHTVPASFADPAHIDGDGKAELIWGSVAKTGGAAPQFDDQTGGCAGTYCHSGGKFGTNPVPVWTEVGTDQAACGTCHELPPSTATGHPAILDGVSCITCHRTVVDADLAIIDKSLHMNGTTEATCATCHTLPPSGDHPQEPTQCSLCHSNVIDANFEFINEALHNNGQTNF